MVIRFAFVISLLLFSTFLSPAQNSRQTNKIEALGRSSGDSLLISVDQQGTVYYWDARSREVIDTLKLRLKFTPGALKLHYDDSSLLHYASATFGQELWLWSDSLKQRFPQNYGAISRLYQTEEMAGLIILNTLNNNLYKYKTDTENNNQTSLALDPLLLSTPVTDIVVSPDYNRLAVLYKNGAVEVRSTTDFSVENSYKFNTSEINRFKWFAGSDEFVVLHKHASLWGNDEVLYRQKIGEISVTEMFLEEADNYVLINDFDICSTTGEVVVLFNNQRGLVIYDQVGALKRKLSLINTSSDYQKEIFLNAVLFDQQGSKLHLAGNRRDETPVFGDWNFTNETLTDWMGGSLKEARLVSTDGGVKMADVLLETTTIAKFPTGKANTYNLPKVNRDHSLFFMKDEGSDVLFYLVSKSSPEEVRVLKNIKIPLREFNSFQYVQPITKEIFFTPDNQGVRVLTYRDDTHYLFTFNKQLQLTDFRSFKNEIPGFSSETRHLFDEDLYLVKSNEYIHEINLSEGKTRQRKISQVANDARYLIDTYNSSLRSLPGLGGLFIRHYEALSSQELLIVESNKILNYHLPEKRIIWQVEHKQDFDKVWDIEVNRTEGLVGILMATTENELYYLAVGLSDGKLYRGEKIIQPHKAAYLSDQADVISFNFDQVQFDFAEQSMSWQVETDKPELVVQTGGKDVNFELSVSPRANYYSLFNYSELQIYDSRSGRQVFSVDGSLEKEHCKFSHDERYLLCRKSNQLIGYSLPNGQEELLYTDSPTSDPYAIASGHMIVSHDAPQALIRISANPRDTLKIIDYERSEVIFEYALPKGSYTRLHHLDVPNQRIVYSLDKNDRRSDIIIHSLTSGDKEVISTPNNAYKVDLGKTYLISDGLQYDFSTKKWLDFSYPTTYAVDTKANLVYSSNITSSSIYDVTNQELIEEFKTDYSRDDYDLIDTKFSDASKLVMNSEVGRLFSVQSFKVEIWDTESISKIKEVENKVKTIANYYLDQERGVISLKPEYQEPVVLDLSKGKIAASVLKIPFTSTSGESVFLDRRGDVYFAGAGRWNDKVALYRYDHIQDSIFQMIEGVTDFEVSPDGQVMVAESKNDLIFFDVKSLREIKRLRGSFPVSFSSRSDWLAYKASNASIRIAGIQNEQSSSITFSGDLDLMRFNTYDQNLLIKLKTDLHNVNWRQTERLNKSTWSYAMPHTNEGVLHVTNESLLVYGVSYSSQVEVANVSDKKVLYTLSTHKDKVIHIDESEKFIITSSEDGTTKFWSKENFTEVASLMLFGNEDFMITTPDGYFMSSREGTRAASYRFKDRIYPFDQFDLQFNRPDIVLDRLGFTPKSSIKALANAYEKRKRRAGVLDSEGDIEFHLPNVEVLDKSAIPISTRNRNLTLKFKAWDEKYNLASYNLWINDVPIFGLGGVKVTASNAWQQEVELQLSQGSNQIKVSCRNEKGTESLQEIIEVFYKDESVEKPNLHIVVVSVSDYQDDRYDLQYAAKDGQDLVDLLSGEDDDYDEIFIHPFFNVEATRENIIGVKRKLLETSVDDRVVLFVSGHGLLDNDFNWWFATYDVDFSTPENRGVSFEDFEYLLDSIPARNKLMMMDACHSGEVDKDPIYEVAFEEKPVESAKNLVAVNFRGDTTRGFKSNLGLQNSFQLMQQLFVDLSRGSGTHVISAAAGDSYALESLEWKNGIFTYAVLDGIKNQSADENKDKLISVSELKAYVTEVVVRETGGRQQPTSRKENLANDFLIWNGRIDQ